MDAPYWILGESALPLAELKNRTKHADSAGGDTPAAGNQPAPAFLLARLGSLACCYVCLETLNHTVPLQLRHAAMQKQHFAAKSRLQMPPQQGAQQAPAKQEPQS